MGHLTHRTEARHRCRDKAGEGLVEADRTRIEDRMNFTRENYRMMREQLLKIDYWQEGDIGPRPRAQDKDRSRQERAHDGPRAALRRDGMVKKPIGAIVKEYRYDPLPDESPRRDHPVVEAWWTAAGRND